MVDTEVRQRLIRKFLMHLKLTVAGAVAGVSFGIGMLLSNYFGLVLMGKTVWDSLETTKEFGIAGAVLGAVIGLLVPVAANSYKPNTPKSFESFDK